MWAIQKSSLLRLIGFLVTPVSHTHTTCYTNASRYSTAFINTMNCAEIVRTPSMEDWKCAFEMTVSIESQERYPLSQSWFSLGSATTNIFVSLFAALLPHHDETYCCDQNTPPSCQVQHGYMDRSREKTLPSGIAEVRKRQVEGNCNNVDNEVRNRVSGAVCCWY